MSTQEHLEVQQYHKVSGAIDFFSQILHLEQLADYGHPFITALLDLRSSSLYMKESDRGGYVLKRSILDEVPIDFFEDSERFKQVATKIGHVMTSGFERIFESDFLDRYQMAMFFPLIVQDELIGFIISKETNECLENTERSYVENIKNLANMAFFIGINSEKRKAVEGTMDRRLYNMMLLHQVNRLLLSELKLEALYQLCVDSVRELTASSVTSFALMDSYKDAIVVRAFSDIITFRSFYGEVKRRNIQRPSRIVFNLENDREELERYFEDLSIFERLSTDYIVLLVGEGIEGFVTIGKPVSGVPFTTDTLDLVESVMLSVRIALNNAIHLEELKTQKKLIDESYGALTQLNKTMKTLNSCITTSELCELVMKTLEIHNGIVKGFIALWDTEIKAYRVIYSNGIGAMNDGLLLDDEARLQLENGIYYHNDPAHINRWLTGNAENAQLSLIAPIAIEGIEEAGNQLFGFIVGLESNKPILMMQLHYMENLALGIAPMLRQMLQEDQILKTRKETPVDQLMRLLTHYETERQEYFMDYVVYYKKLDVNCFEEIDLKPYEPLKPVILHNWLIAPAYEEQIIAEERFDGVIAGTYSEIIDQLKAL